MTSIAHRYASFGSLDSDGQLADTSSVEQLEDENLQVFEDGYQAGWTDAETNHTTEQKNISDEMLQALRESSFTYQEALVRLNRGLKPMFEQMISTLLPKTSGAVLRAHVIEQLLEMSASQTDAHITLRVSESDLQMLQGLLDEAEFKMPISLSSDKSLNPHQLFVSLDMLEREINLDAVCHEITEAMNAFNFHSQMEHVDV
jgi:flagellar biosynthesis/type III secretory pathway protein FliH